MGDQAIEDLPREPAPQVLGALVRRIGEFGAAKNAAENAVGKAVGKAVGEGGAAG